jgi:methionyl-tRNA formyltransferase
MSIVFIGTPEFAVPSLRRLAADGFGITAVLTQPDRPAGRGRALRPSPVAMAAEELAISVLKPPSLRDPAATAQLAALKPEAIVTVAYGQILRREVLDIPPRGVLNVHPSLLPRWRGATPVQAAILAGDRTTGVTIILMDAGMDTGPILSQVTHPIDDSDTAGTLLDKLATVAAGLLSETLRQWLDSGIKPQPQDDSSATTCPLLRKEDGKIDWSLSAEAIWRSVRAHSPWPGAYTTLGGELLHIWQAWPTESTNSEPPGIVVPIPDALRPSLAPHAEGAAFAVSTGDGLLAVIEAQRAGKRSLPSAELLRGLPGLLGARLGS